MKRFLLGALVLALAACGDGSSGGSPAGKKKYRFALVPKMLSNDVFNYGRMGAVKTAKEIEAKENCEIEILWQAPAQSNPAQQASIVQTMANQKVSGISVSVDEANTLTQAINYAVDKGVPVMTFDSDAPGSKRKVFYGTDDLECGEKLAHYLGTMITKGKVIIQTGTDAPNLANRVKGAQDCFKAHFPGIEVVQIYKCNDDLQKAIQQLAGAVSTYPDLAGMLLVGGWAVFGDKGLDAVDPAKTKVVSCDALPKGWQYLENGKAAMLLAQDLWGWGAQSVRLLKDLADGKPVQAGPDGRINGTLEEITKGNLEAFKKTWAERFGAPR
jgi:ribose transport system substrate-binding protein